MELTVNGEKRQMAAANIGDLLAAELDGQEARGIAVAVNGRVVPRSQWNSAALKEGDRVEIVRALPGG